MNGQPQDQLISHRFHIGNKWLAASFWLEWRERKREIGEKRLDSELKFANSRTSSNGGLKPDWNKILATQSSYQTLCIYRFQSL
mgnify:CR=1 FL=1